MRDPRLVVRVHAGGTYLNPALVVGPAGADAAIRALHAAGLLDPARRIHGRDPVVIPVLARPELADWAARLDARLVEDDAPRPRLARRTPREDVLDRLRDRLPAARLAEVPDKWEQLGDVLVLRLPPSLLPHGADVGAAFASALRLKCVLHDPGGVAGEFRTMRAEPLVGEDPVATHVENGVRFRFDASRVMFSSGNVAERTRAAALACEGETIVDMFAGIGYFTLPIAVHQRPARIHALEKNPVAFHWLEENVALNDVGRVVSPWRGDNRDFPEEGVADRVLMGYFPGTQAYLPKAARLLRPGGGRLHYHNTAHAERWRDELVGQVRAVLPSARVEEARVVKTHSPGVVHAVVVVEVG